MRARVEDGLLHHVVLQLSGDGFTALGVMNRLSGSAEEILEVSGQDTKRQVVNLAEVDRPQGPADRAAARRLGAGGPAARHRAGVLAFLDAVRAGKVLSARDALATHELCERVVTCGSDRAPPEPHGSYALARAQHGEDQQRPPCTGQSP